MSQVLKEWPQEGEGGIEQLKSDTQEEILFSGLRRRRKENANFSAELLPVTCGNLKGVLHKDKFKQGGLHGFCFANATFWNHM